MAAAFLPQSNDKLLKPMIRALQSYDDKLKREHRPLQSKLDIEIGIMLARLDQLLQLPAVPHDRVRELRDWLIEWESEDGLVSEESKTELLEKLRLSAGYAVMT